MKIAFCHHLSLSYNAGGEQWIIETANELLDRGHKVSIHALPFLLEGERKTTPEDLLSDEIEYQEGYRHTVEGDVVYVTYNPLSWLFFKTKGKRIAGIHSHAYWQPISRKYGLLPNVANVMHKVLNELPRYDAVHTVTDAHMIEHENLYTIPNYVDSKVYRPNGNKSDEFRVGFASRKVWQKGYEMFLELSKLLSDAGIDFVVTNNFPESDMPDYYSSNATTLVLSIAGTYDFAVVKSLMCETPVISSGLPAHRRLGLPIIYGGSIPKYIGEIVKMMMMYDTQEYHALIKRCREQAVQKYDKPIIMDRIERMFKEVESF